MLICLGSTGHAQRAALLDSIVTYSITHTVKKDSFPFDKVYFSYDHNGLKTERMRMQTDNLVHWYPKARRQYLYDTRGRLTLQCNDSFITSTQTWKRFKCDSFFWINDTHYHHIRAELSGKPATGTVEHKSYIKNSEGKIVRTAEIRRVSNGKTYEAYVDSFHTVQKGNITEHHHKRRYYSTTLGIMRLASEYVGYVNVKNSYLHQLDSTVYVSYKDGVKYYKDKEVFTHQPDSGRLKAIHTRTYFANNVALPVDSKLFYMHTRSSIDSSVHFKASVFQSTVSWRLESFKRYTWEKGINTLYEFYDGHDLEVREGYDRTNHTFDTIPWTVRFSNGRDMSTPDYVNRWIMRGGDGRPRHFTRYNFSNTDDSLVIDFRHNYFYSRLPTHQEPNTLPGAIVYPNPSNGLINIQLEKKDGIKVIDQLGREIYHASEQKQYQVVIDKPGVYVLVTSLGSQKLVIK